MDNSKLIALKQDLLRKEIVYKKTISNLKPYKKLKNYTLVFIPILLIIVIFCSEYKVNINGRPDMYYYPFSVYGSVILVFIIPFVFILFIIGYLKSKKLYQIASEEEENILKIKCEIIVLEHTK